MIMSSKHRLPAAASLLLVGISTLATLVSTLATSIAALATTITTLAASITALAASTVTTLAASIAASATVTTTITAASAEAAAAAGATLACFVDTDGATIELNVVHGSDGSIGIGLLAVANETETTAASGITVLDYDSLLYGAELLELLTESILISVPCEASNEELRHLG